MGTRRGLLIAGLLASFVGTTSAHAVEYRLEVANLWETALYAFAKPAELSDGASGPGLLKLEASLDQGAIPHAVVEHRALPPRQHRGGHEAGGVRPVFQEEAAVVDEPVEPPSLIRPEAAPHREVVGALHHVDRVHLDAAHVLDEARQTVRSQAMGARATEVLPVQEERPHGVAREDTHGA